MGKIKNLFRRLRLPVFLLIVGGVVVTGTVFGIGTAYCRRKAGERMRQVFSYMEEQCIRYDNVAAEEETKSLIRTADKVQELRRDFSAEDLTDEDKIRTYLENQRITGLIVTDDAAGTHCVYTSDGLDFDDWRDVLTRVSASAPQRVHTERYTPGDGYCYDFAVTARTDGVSGWIFGYVRQAEMSVTGTRLSVRTLLDGYDFDADGIVAVTDGVTVIGSNRTEWNDRTVTECSLVEAARGEAAFGSLFAVSSPDGTYYTMRGKGDGVFFYAFLPSHTVMRDRTALLAYSLVFYLVLAGTVLLLRQRSKNAQAKAGEAARLRYSEEMDKLAGDAIRANEVKADFLRRMSHDLRTPINGIRGMLDIADYYADDKEKQAECRKKIRDASGLLLDLVNDVLDMKTSGTEESLPPSEPFLLSPLLDEVKTVMTEVAAERGILLDEEERYLPHDCFTGQPLMLKRILMNLVGNAVKYNKEHGKIHLSCRENGFSDGVAHVVFVISDTGIGMSAEFQKHMFEPFAKEDTSVTAAYSGVGLGLSIVKNLIELLHGTISVASRQGEGTTFTVMLPLREDASRPTSAAADPQATASLAGKTILVAEDNELNLEFAEFILKKAGATYITAKNGEEAVMRFLHSAPHEIDAVLMDVMMPVEDGLQATTRIRASGREDADVPVIAMTAGAGEEDVLAAEAAGINGCLTKPLRADGLLAVIAELTEKKEIKT